MLYWYWPIKDILSGIAINSSYEPFPYCHLVIPILIIELQNGIIILLSNSTSDKELKWKLTVCLLKSWQLYSVKELLIRSRRTFPQATTSAGCSYLLKRIHLPDHIISRTWSTWNWFLLVVINVIPFSPIQCTTRPDFNKVPLVPPPLVLHGFLVN